MMRSSPFPFHPFRLTSRPSAAPSSLTTCETRTPSRHSRRLRACAFGMGSLVLWTLGLAAPVNALALPSNEKPLPTYHKPTLPKPVDDPTWHTIDYHAAEKQVSKKALPLKAIRAQSLTLLDDAGRLGQSVPVAQVAGWKQQLRRVKPLPPAQAAKLHMWLGEYEMTHDEQPEHALLHFAQALRLTHSKDALHGLAAYDQALGLFSCGAYTEAASAFHHVLTARPTLRGFDRRTCALWYKHANACVGYHQERAALGITEPSRLDPLCGAAALAQSLKALGRPYDKKTVLAQVRVTGRGSTLQDVLEGAAKFGLTGRAVQTDDTGLIALPKPLVAYVEHDHFVSLLRADKQGVSYLCSDCGKWPGGRIDLTWRQWHKMEA